MLKPKVNSGGEEIIEYDDGERVVDDGYSMAEALDGEDFEYIKCPGTMSGVQNVTHIVYFFTMVWESGTIQPKTLCNTTQNRQLKDFVSPHLVRCIDDGTYWMHELGDG